MNKDNVFNPNFLNQPQQVQKNKDDIEYLIKNQFKVFNTTLNMFEGMESVAITETDIPADFSGENAVLLTRNGLIFKIVTITDNIVYIKYYSQLPQGPAGPAGSLPEWGEPDQIIARYGYGAGEYGWSYGKVPSGGMPNQVLTKYGYGDNEYQWEDATGGGGGGGDSTIKLQQIDYNYPKMVENLTQTSVISADTRNIPNQMFANNQVLLCTQCPQMTDSYITSDGGIFSMYTMHSFPSFFLLDLSGEITTPVLEHNSSQSVGFQLNINEGTKRQIAVNKIDILFYSSNNPFSGSAIMPDEISATNDGLAWTGGCSIQNIDDINNPYTMKRVGVHNYIPIIGSDSISIDVNEVGTRFVVKLDEEVNNKLARSLVTPLTAPSSTALVGIGTNNAQTNITIGSGLTLTGNTLSAPATSPTYMYFVSFEIINAASYNSKIQMTAFSSGEKIVPDGNAKNFLKQLVTRIASSDALSATPANIKYPATGTINDTPIKYAECISTGSLSVYGTGDENTIYNFDNEDTTVANFQVSVIKV